MTLIEEKKLVATRLMGWEVVEIPVIGFFVQTLLWIPNIIILLDSWKPELERKWWDNIWDKMDDEVYQKYMNNLADLLEVGFNVGDKTRSWKFHTAKPETCWKALLQTINQ